MPPTTATSAPGTAGATRRRIRSAASRATPSSAVGGWLRPQMLDQLVQLRHELVGVARVAEQLGQLADQDDQRDAVQIAGQDRLGQEGGDEAEPGRAGDQVEHAGHQREDRQQGQIPFRVAGRERPQAGSDQQAGGGVRPDDQLSRRAEQRIGEQREDRRVDADRPRARPPDRRRRGRPAGRSRRPKSRTGRLWAASGGRTASAWRTPARDAPVGSQARCGLGPWFWRHSGVGFPALTRECPYARVSPNSTTTECAAAG